MSDTVWIALISALGGTVGITLIKRLFDYFGIFQTNQKDIRQELMNRVRELEEKVEKSQIQITNLSAELAAEKAKNLTLLAQLNAKEDEIQGLSRRIDLLEKLVVTRNLKEK